MNSRLARCDAGGEAAYLEASSDANIAYYERFGFEVTGRIDLGPELAVHPMWRDPR